MSPAIQCFLSFMMLLDDAAFVLFSRLVSFPFIEPAPIKHFSAAMLFFSWSSTSTTLSVTKISLTNIKTICFTPLLVDVVFLRGNNIGCMYVIEFTASDNIFFSYETDMNVSQLFLSISLTIFLVYVYFALHLLELK